ncbi:MAG: hypothetical protein WCG87_08035 [Bacteroidota bacterium]
MKHLLLMLAAIVIVTSSCRKNENAVNNKISTNYAYTATIKGPSPFMTACSGLYWIVIDGVTYRTTFDTLPANSGIDLSTATFPISVKLNWHFQNPNNCYIIIVDDIMKVN